MAAMYRIHGPSEVWLYAHPTMEHVAESVVETCCHQEQLWDPSITDSQPQVSTFIDIYFYFSFNKGTFNKC